MKFASLAQATQAAIAATAQVDELTAKVSEMSEQLTALNTSSVAINEKIVAVTAENAQLTEQVAALLTENASLKNAEANANAQMVATLASVGVEPASQAPLKQEADSVSKEGLWATFHKLPLEQQSAFYSKHRAILRA